MGAGAEELQGEGSVAVLVQTMVVEDVGGAEQDCVALVRLVDPEQGGQAAARVAAVGMGRLGGVPLAAEVGIAGAARGGEGALGVRAETGAGASVRMPGASASMDAGPAERRTVRPPDEAVAVCKVCC